MPRLALIAAVLFCCVAGVGTTGTLVAQSTPEGQKPKLVSPPAKANVTLTGATVTIDYSAPSAHGRTIFGGLVPYGEVWRTGANSATTLKTSGNLQIGSLAVPAGTYTLYSLPTADGWTLIVNKQNGQWGTVYDKSQDLGRVPMSAGSNSVPVETFVIDFEKTIGSATELHLKWAGVDASVQVNAVK
jgi:Protein of unknown function (DUF2911)